MQAKGAATSPHQFNKFRDIPSFVTGQGGIAARPVTLLANDVCYISNRRLNGSVRVVDQHFRSAWSTDRRL
jgi:hypothetical protein